MNEKIRNLLKIYRIKLHQAEENKNYADALRFDGALQVLELLYIYVLEEESK